MRYYTNELFEGCSHSSSRYLNEIGKEQGKRETEKMALGNMATGKMTTTERKEREGEK